VELETSSHVDEHEPCLRLRGRALQPRLMQCNATRCGGWIFHEQGRGGNSERFLSPKPRLVPAQSPDGETT
jgi:hypothetical protein